MAYHGTSARAMNMFTIVPGPENANHAGREMRGQHKSAMLQGWESLRVILSNVNLDQRPPPHKSSTESGRA